MNDFQFPHVSEPDRPWVSDGNGHDGHWGYWPDTNPHQRGAPYAVQGLLAVPSGATNFLPPFFLPIEPGSIAKFIGVRAMVRSATSITCNVQQNGSTIAGMTGIVVTTSASSFSPTTPIDVSDGDYFAPVITAVSGTPDGLSMTFYFQVWP